MLKAEKDGLSLLAFLPGGYSLEDVSQRGEMTCHRSYLRVEALGIEPHLPAPKGHNFQLNILLVDLLGSLF